MQGTKPLVSFNLLVLDLLAILQRTEAVSLDAGVVNEYILPFGVENEAESLLHVEPLHRAYQHRSSHNELHTKLEPDRAPAQKMSAQMNAACAATSRAGLIDAPLSFMLHEVHSRVAKISLSLCFTRAANGPPHARSAGRYCDHRPPLLQA